MRSALPSRATIGLALLALSLVAGLWLSEPLTAGAIEAAPAAQAQASPTPRQPRPTRTPEEELRELEKRKLELENGLLFEQRKRLEQQRDIDLQGWRAPAEAIATVGPTLVGLGLLMLASRALSHFLPPRPASPRAAPTEADEDEEEF